MTAERIEITVDEANALFSAARGSTMTEEDKIRFRRERAEWAEKGGLEDAPEPKPLPVSLLSPKDIPEIEEAVRTKVMELYAKQSNGGVDSAEMNRVFAVVNTLRARNLIGDQVFGEAEAFFGMSVTPVSERGDD